MAYRKITTLIVLSAFILAGCQSVLTNNRIKDTQSDTQYAGKKIVYINSYHRGYTWSDGIEKGVRRVLEPKQGLQLTVLYMDAKNITEEKYLKVKALEIKGEIEKIRPDVIITSDDAAFKYVIQPYYKDASIPVVFSGLNWDAKVYDAPYSNTTGMVEISLVQPIMDYMKKYAKGNRIGFLSNDDISEHKDMEWWEKIFKMKLDKKYVRTMADWKKAFVELQTRNDMILMNNNAAISDWNEAEMVKFTEDNAKIPSATINDWMMKYNLVGLIKDPSEQGEWPAQTALKILSGTQVGDIPLVNNTKGDLYLNFKIAKKLGIIFDPSMIETAKVIIQ